VGVVPEQEDLKRENKQEALEHVKRFLTFDHICESCDDSDELRKSCKFCGGKGYVPNAAGHELLKFLRDFKDE
jgi:hypothetical protein